MAPPLGELSAKLTERASTRLRGPPTRLREPPVGAEKIRTPCRENGRAFVVSRTCINSLAAHRGKALAAIHGTVLTREERNLGGLAAVGADRVMHFAGSTGSRAAGLASGTAGLAAGGLILEALFGVEFLLTCSPNEFVATVFANQRLVFVHGKETPKKMISVNFFG